MKAKLVKAGKVSAGDRVLLNGRVVTVESARVFPHVVEVLFDGYRCAVLPEGALVARVKS